MKTLGQVLKEARERAGLTQEAVAKRIGVATSQISQVEAGRRVDPQFSTVAKMAAATGISLDQIAAQCGLRGYVETRARPESEKHDVAVLASASRLRGLQKHLESLAQRFDAAIANLSDSVGPDERQTGRRKSGSQKRHH